MRLMATTERIVLGAVNALSWKQILTGFKRKRGMESEMEAHFLSGKLWHKMIGAKGQGQISEKPGSVAGSTQR